MIILSILAAFSGTAHATLIHNYSSILSPTGSEYMLLDTGAGAYESMTLNNLASWIQAPLTSSIMGKQSSLGLFTPQQYDSSAGTVTNHDCTIGLQNAASAALAASSALTIPAGSYWISTNITFSCPVILLPGSVFYKLPSTACTMTFSGGLEQSDTQTHFSGVGSTYAWKMPAGYLDSSDNFNLPGGINLPGNVSSGSVSTESLAVSGSATAQQFCLGTACVSSWPSTYFPAGTAPGYDFSGIAPKSEVDRNMTDSATASILPTGGSYSANPFIVF